jgi:hypothetical protein
MTVDPARDQEHEAPRHDGPADPDGSGTVGADTEQQRQAGSYARDAEQDPSLGRHHQAAE